MHGCKVYMDFYMASIGSFIMVTWTISKITSCRLVQHKTGRPCVEPIFWPSPVRIGLLSNFDDFHLAIGGWTSSGVDERGD